MEGLGKWGRLTGIWFPAVRKLMLFAAIFLTVEGFASFSGAMFCLADRVVFWIRVYCLLLIYTRLHFPVVVGVLIFLPLPQ